MKKAQNWSLEIIVVLSFFTVIFVTMITLFVSESSEDIEVIQIRAQGLLAKLVTSELNNPSQFAFVERGIVNENKWNEFATSRTTVLQQELGINGDFCVYFEDDNGNLLLLGYDASGNYLYGIGSGSIRLDSDGIQYPCGELA